MSFFFHATKKRLLQAGKQHSGSLQAGKKLILLGGAFYASGKVNTYVTPKILDYAEKASLDGDSKFQLDVGIDVAVSGLIPIAFYGGFLKLDQEYQRSGSKFKWFPSFPNRPPMSIPGAVGVAMLTFTAAPLLEVVVATLSLPVIKRFDATTVQRGEVPAQTNAGSKVASVYETAVPGSMTCIIPLQEEILYRGLIFGHVSRSIRTTHAALISSIIFGYAHKGADGLKYLPLTETLGGLLYSWLYYRTGRLLVPFAAHAGHNSLFMLLSSLDSCSKKLGAKWLHSMTNESSQERSHVEELTFWERRVAESFKTVMTTITESLVWLQTKNENTPEQYVPFLPLDLLGEEESVSRNSIFFDNEKGRLLKSPVLLNPDGSLSRFAQHNIESRAEALFGNEESISINRLNDYVMAEKKMELLVHVLATMPEQVRIDSNQTLEQAWDSIKGVGESLPKSQHHHFFDEILSELGINIMFYQTGNISRAEYKKDFSDALRSRLYTESQANRDLFICFCMVALRQNKAAQLIGISDLLKEYCEKEKEFLLEKPLDESDHGGQVMGAIGKVRAAQNPSLKLNL